MEYFRDIIGQEAAVEHLQNAIRTGEVSHAYLLCGDKGSGKRLLAGVFAATLQCETRGEEDNSGGEQPVEELIERCGHCHSCAQVETGNQPDIITVTHEKKSSSDKRTDLSVDDIRRMVSDVPVKPYSSPYKIYILPDADRMTVQAQNALLKTLEEPPAYAVVILLATSVSPFLPTVLSRCVTLMLRPVPEEKVLRYLQSRSGISDERARILSRFAAGSIGRALELSESEAFGELHDRTVDLLRGLPGKTSYDLIQFAKEVTKEKEDVQEFLTLARSWYRDVLVYLETRQADCLIFGGEVQYIIEAAMRSSREKLARVNAAFETAERQMRYNTNLELILEVLLLELRGNG